MTRRHARELALQTLYSIAVGHHEPAFALEQTASAEGSGDRGYVREFVYGTLEFADASDALIAPLLQGWTIERLPLLDRLVMRMGVYELLHRPETPRAVAINEAIELAKKFSTDDSGRYVNGVLAALDVPIAPPGGTTAHAGAPAGEVPSDETVQLGDAAP